MHPADLRMWFFDTMPVLLIVAHHLSCSDIPVPINLPKDSCSAPFLDGTNHVAFNLFVGALLPYSLAQELVQGIDAVMGKCLSHEVSRDIRRSNRLGLCPYLYIGLDAPPVIIIVGLQVWFVLK